MTAARSRTVAHMQRLVATATAAASAASCTREADVKTVTITPLPTVTPTDTDIAAPPPPPTASATLNVPPPPVPPPDPSGYLVVDMLPAPARCLGVAASAQASGKFHRDSSGIVLDLVVTIPSSAPGGATFTGATPTAWSGSIVSSSYRSHNSVAVVRARPTAASPGQAAFGVQIPVSCGAAGTGTMAVNISYTAPAVDGSMPTFSLHDY